LARNRRPSRWNGTGAASYAFLIPAASASYTGSGANRNAFVFAFAAPASGHSAVSGWPSLACVHAARISAAQSYRDTPFQASVSST
jgi:hypothetical protein